MQAKYIVFSSAELFGRQGGGEQIPFQPSGTRCQNRPNRRLNVDKSDRDNAAARKRQQNHAAQIARIGKSSLLSKKKLL